MSARRLMLATLGLLCALVCVLAVGVAGAGAATSFGGFSETEGATGGIAINQASGDVYATERFNDKVKKFDAAGELLAEWGSQGSGVGQFAAGTGSYGPTGVAVDNELGSLSYGDVYVIDESNHRVEKFDSEGKFLLMFGGGVNEKTAGDVCVVGEACTKGTEGSADGQFEWFYEGKFIAVGPDGKVYVGDKARVQVFEPSGVWRENISLVGLSATGEVEQLAVDASGDMFVKDSEVAGVREFEPGGNEVATQLDAGSTTVTGLAVDGSGDLFVGDSSGGFHLLKYGSAGKELESYAWNTLNGNQGLAFAGEATGDLYALGYVEIRSGNGSRDEGRVWIIAPPPPGPLLEPGSVSVVPGLRGHASFHAIVNPEGQETSYRYEYVDQAQFEANGYASAVSTPEVSIGSSFENQSAEASVEGLTPGVTYHYRIVASSSATATSPDQSFEETPPALIDGPWAQDVASTSATLSAGIDPLGANTTYRLEWGTNTSYGQTLSGSVGEGMSSVPIGYYPLLELAPDTTYHYRLVTVNEVGRIEGADHTFTTQPPGGQRTLPDGRAWELVSPPNKKGATIEPFHGYNDVIQAADNGAAITYPSAGPAVGANPPSRSIESTVLSRRGADGWSSTDIDIPRRNVNEGESAFGLGLGGTGEYGVFSPDLSLAVAEPTGSATPLLASEATERTLYIRNNENGSFLPLVTPADVPPGTKFSGEESLQVEGGDLAMRFVAATPDLSHVLLASPLVLAPGAAFKTLSRNCEGKPAECGYENLYEWSVGHLQLVNILPNGKSTNTEHLGSPVNANIVGEDGGNEGGFGLVPHPVSADGRWVAWTWGSPFAGEKPYDGLYLRDMVKEKTVRVGGNNATYQTMTSDGSRIFYLENGDLYEFDTATATATDLTAKHGGEENAGVQESVSDVTEDGSYVYFVATGVLAHGGLSGADNLYLLHYTGSEWTTTYIATLSADDGKSWSGSNGGKGESPYFAGISSRVSPDGRYLAFMSDRSLTGYDNIDVNSGQPDEEVYLYDSATGRLACASCNPSGARPVGVSDDSSKQLLVDSNEFWGSRAKIGGENSTSAYGEHWLAASLPGWVFRVNYQSSYQPRYLSNGGRLFFNSADALAPQDTNGVEDVYEYEPPSGPGTVGSDNCTTSSPTYSARSEGCISLISSGTSSSESVFYDTSESGDDVFFITASRLVAADYDDTYDVYDAHACSAAAPCQAEPVSPPPCTSGDSCKAAPSPQPEIFGPAPSATFSGVGNVVEEAKKTVVKPKAKAKHKKRVKHTKRKAKKAKKAHTGRAGKKGGKR